MIRQEQCDKVCRILDDVLANRPAERDSLIIAVRKAFESLEQFGNSEPLPSAQPEPRTAYWTKDIVGSVVCSNCGEIREDNRIGHTQWCNCCGCFMRGE